MAVTENQIKEGEEKNSGRRKRNDLLEESKLKNEHENMSLQVVVQQ